MCSIIQEHLWSIQCQRLADLWQNNECSGHDGEDDVDPKQPAQEDKVRGHARPKVTSKRQRKTSD